MSAVQLGMIGLGRMGANMTRRLARDGHAVTVFDLSAVIEQAAPADVLAASVFARVRSRQDHTFGEKVLSAMRHKFGGHIEPPSGG